MNPIRLFILLAATATLGLSAGCGGQDEDAGGGQQPGVEQAGETGGGEELETPPAISVYFESPADGARVTSPFDVEMAADGVEVAPAGTMEEGTGHMHILIDVPFVPAGEVIPTDDAHRHYGDGSTTAKLDLPPGNHVLRLQLADGAHRAFEGEEYRDDIRVQVEAAQQSDGEEGDQEAGDG